MYRRVLQALSLRQTWARISITPLTGPVTLGMFREIKMTLKSLYLSQGVEARMHAHEEGKHAVQPQQA